MEQTKLQINKIAGIAAIIGAVIFPISFWFIAAGAFADITNIVEGGSGVGATSGTVWFFNILAIALLGLFIYAMIESKKVNIKTTGHILGIIGSAYYFISPIFPGFVAMILLIIAAVFTLKQESMTSPAQ